ncbi:MAG: hypothetical protein QM784_32580 [Polyangiaceae bacterium]
MSSDIRVLPIPFGTQAKNPENVFCPRYFPGGRNLKTVTKGNGPRPPTSQ